MTRENWKLWWRYHPHGSPAWALQIGPLRLLWWAHGRGRWYVHRGYPHWLAGSLGKLEWLFWDRGLC